MVRCGRCQTQFDVPGEGRFACPTCGAVNEVRSAASAANGLTTPGFRQPDPSPARSSVPKAHCESCDFEFFVGDIETAICPNCGSEVSVSEEAVS